MSRTISKKKIEQFKIFLLEDEKANETIVKYIRELEAFLCFIGENTVSKEKVIKYKHHLMACYAPTSVNCKLAAINRFLRWQGWYDCTVKALKIQRQAFRPKEQELSKDEYFRLLKVAKEKEQTPVSHDASNLFYGHKSRRAAIHHGGGGPAGESHRLLQGKKQTGSHPEEFAR